MVKKIFMILILGVSIFGISKLSLAMMCGGKMHLAQTGHQDTEESAVSEKPVDVGNKICPVSGEKIDEKAKATYEYKGKIYNFCCASCVEEFKKDPDKYIKKVEEEIESESEAKSKEHMMMPESKASGHHGSHH